MNTVLNYRLPKYDEEAELENSTKVRMSMQAVVNQALASRMPQGAGGPPPQQQLATAGGFSGTAQ